MVESPEARIGKKYKLPKAARRRRPLFVGIKKRRAVIEAVRAAEIEGGILLVQLETREIVSAPRSSDLELKL